MIDFAKVKKGDKLRIVGAGAPGYARLGDIVTVMSCNGTNRVDVIDMHGEPAYFALTCGAARLEIFPQDEPVPADSANPLSSTGESK